MRTDDECYTGTGPAGEVVGSFWPTLPRATSALHSKSEKGQPTYTELLAQRDELRAEVERLKGENANLKTVMVAAAEEIHQHWDAHCDAEGYGPANLMRRLEEGIPSQYGYTAGAFAELRQRADTAEALLRQALEALELRCGTNAEERNELIPALRERLESKT